MKNIAIILASGTGERTGLNIPKQFVKVAGKTIFEHTLDTFEKHPLIDEIIVVSNINYIEQAQNLVIKIIIKNNKNIGWRCNAKRKFIYWNFINKL